MMKIVDRKDFLKMKEGTVYAKHEVIGQNNICVKYESLEDDWWYLCFGSIDADDDGELFDRMHNMLEKGASYPVNQLLAREGLHEVDQKFMIYETDDIDFMVSELKGGK